MGKKQIERKIRKFLGETPWKSFSLSEIVEGTSFGEREIRPAMAKMIFNGRIYASPLLGYGKRIGQEYSFASRKPHNNNAGRCDCMVDEGSCKYPKIKIEGKIYQRIIGEDNGEICHDCDVLNERGKIHHFGCDMEPCPKCGDQLISCECYLQELISEDKSIKLKYGTSEIEEKIQRDHELMRLNLIANM